MNALSDIRGGGSNVAMISKAKGVLKSRRRARGFCTCDDYDIVNIK